MSTEADLKRKLIQKISPRYDSTYDSRYERNLPYSWKEDGFKGAKNLGVDTDYRDWHESEVKRRTDKVNKRIDKRKNRILKFSGGSDELNALFQELYDPKTGELKVDRKYNDWRDDEEWANRYSKMTDELYNLAGREGVNVDKLLRKFKRTTRVKNRRLGRVDDWADDNREYRDIPKRTGYSTSYTDVNSHRDSYRIDSVRGADNDFKSELHTATSRKNKASWSMLDDNTKKLLNSYKWESSDQYNKFIEAMFLGDEKEMDKIIGIYDADGNFVKENWKEKDELIDKLVSSPHWVEDLNPYTNNMHYNEETGELDDKFSKKYAWHDAKGEKDYGNEASFRLKHKLVRDKDIKRRVVDRKLFDSDRQVYRRKDPSTGEYKYYTQWSINNMGGKEREISKKRYWKIRKKMDKRQSRIRGSEFNKGDVSE